MFPFCRVRYCEYMSDMTMVMENVSVWDFWKHIVHSQKVSDLSLSLGSLTWSGFGLRYDFLGWLRPRSCLPSHPAVDSCVARFHHSLPASAV